MDKQTEPETMEGLDELRQNAEAQASLFRMADDQAAQREPAISDEHSSD